MLRLAPDDPLVRRFAAAQFITCARPGCTTEFIRLRGSHRYCSKACTDRASHPPRTSGPGKSWAKGAQRVPRETCKECGSPFYCAPVYKRRGGGSGSYCSRKCYHAVMARDPSRFPQTVSRRGNGGKRADLGGMYFRSAWEANFARYLNWLKERKQIRGWEYEKRTFEFVGIKRGTRFYTPDFEVFENDGRSTLYEIKGYMDERSATKLKRMARYHPGVKITLFQKRDYDSLKHKLSAAIPNWE